MGARSVTSCAGDFNADLPARELIPGAWCGDDIQGLLRERLRIDILSRGSMLLFADSDIVSLLPQNSCAARLDKLTQPPFWPLRVLPPSTNRRMRAAPDRRRASWG